MGCGGKKKNPPQSMLSRIKVWVNNIRNQDERPNINIDSEKIGASRRRITAADVRP